MLYYFCWSHSDYVCVCAHMCAYILNECVEQKNLLLSSKASGLELMYTTCLSVCKRKNFLKCSVDLVGWYGNHGDTVTWSSSSVTSNRWCSLSVDSDKRVATQFTSSSDGDWRASGETCGVWTRVASLVCSFTPGEGDYRIILRVPSRLQPEKPVKARHYRVCKLHLLSCAR